MGAAGAKDAAVAKGEPGLAKIARVTGSALIAGIGGVLAVFMVYAAYRELLAGDFYGVCVTGLVATFGLQLTGIGFRMAMGKRRAVATSDPLHELWRSQERIYPYLPYSRMEIRGR